jgi:hypothetical protein
MYIFEKIVIGFFVVVLFALIAVMGFAIFDFSTGYSCNATTSAMGVEHQYGIIKGCLVYVNNTWIPIDNYIVNKDK